jgi:hypothetical protein
VVEPLNLLKIGFNILYVFTVSKIYLPSRGTGNWFSSTLRSEESLNKSSAKGVKLSSKEEILHI